MEWEFWRIFVVVLVAKSCMALCDPMDCKPPGSSVMGFFKQEYWGGLPFPSPGDLPNPGIEPTSPALAGGFSTTEPPGKPSGKYSSNLTKLTQFKPPGMMSGEQRQGTASRQRGITLVKVQMYKHSKLFPP